MWGWWLSHEAQERLHALSAKVMVCLEISTTLAASLNKTVFAEHRAISLHTPAPYTKSSMRSSSSGDGEGMFLIEVSKSSTRSSNFGWGGEGSW